MLSQGAIDFKIRKITFNINHLDELMKVSFYRDDAHERASNLKRENEELVLSSMNLETQLQKQKEKMIGSEEQLRKLEHKISLSDISLANQVRKFLVKIIR